MANGSGNERFKIRSWNDLSGIVALILIGVGIITWGIKLEIELKSANTQIFNLRTALNEGILPRAEERLNFHTDRIRALESRIKACEERL